MSTLKAIVIVLLGFLFAAFVGYPFDSAIIYLVLWIVCSLSLAVLTDRNNNSPKSESEKKITSQPTAKQVPQSKNERKVLHPRKYILILICVGIVFGGYFIKKSVDTTNEIPIDTKGSNCNSTPPNNSSPYSDSYTEETEMPIPYVGMKESAIGSTLLGQAPQIEKCRDFDHLDNGHKWKKYTWDYGGGKKLVATIYYDGGYGKVVQVDKYPKDPYGNTMSEYWD